MEIAASQRGMDEDRRERLFRLGASALSDAELIAVILGTGTRRQSATELSAALLSHSGGLKGLSQQHPHELRAIARLGPARAAQVLASLELGRRAQRSVERRPRLRTPAEIYEHLSPILLGLRREVFHVLSFNSRNVLLSDVRVAEGTLDHCLVDPREVFSAALWARATAIVLAHNHPSGDPEPSVLDLELTTQLVEGGRILGIKVLDHIVVGDSNYTSLFERTRMHSDGAVQHRVDGRGWSAALKPGPKEL